MQSVQMVIKGLVVEKTDHLLFQGMPNNWPNRHVFGGHVVAQAMAAAELTVDNAFSLHSLQSYFVRPGIADKPISYAVEILRDGRSFLVRRVTAIQNNEAILTLTASFHIGEEGVEHQPTMPDVPPPEDLDDDAEYYSKVLKAFYAGKKKERAYLPFETRAIQRMDITKPVPLPPRTGYWMKLKEPIGDDPALHRRLLAYISDFAFLSSNLRPHAMVPRDPRLKTVASLNHSMWFHKADFRTDSWIFYDTNGYWAGGGRGVARGALFNRDGQLLASTTQESLLRLA